MKATGQYFYVVLFTTLQKVVLTFKCEEETVLCGHSNESYRAVLSYGTLSIILCKVVLTFQSVDETLD